MADNQLSLSDLLLSSGGVTAMGEPPASSNRQETLPIAEVEWWAAIAAVTQLLAAFPRPTDQQDGTLAPEGTVISGPLPVVTEPALAQRFATWVLTPQPLADALMGQRSLLPAAHLGKSELIPMIQALPLQANDGLLRERFCLVHTAQLTMVLVLGQPTGGPWQFQYSFDPNVLMQVWQRLRSSTLPSSDQALGRLAERLADLACVHPDYRLITRFNQLVLAHLPHRTPMPQPDRIRFAAWSPIASEHFTNGVDGASARRPTTTNRTKSAQGSADEFPAPRNDCPSLDAELLQAMAHEIRTPLTTIRTLTRSLLRRSNLDATATQRLQRIDQECTQQIERFNLIFRAAELTGASRHPLAPPLTPIALAQVFEAAIPQWQQQAHRRNLSLDVRLPPTLPKVTSDPALLSQVLTGVVEWFTQGLPAQSHIQMGVVLAGPQLKLQFKAHSEGNGDSPTCPDSSRAQLKSLGQLLTVAPDTGGVSLNLDVTKTLFEALGAKLTVRQRPKQGETLTVFLPLDTREV